jgi:predicted glycoside hydrolase/deacetylase ChbG (UPF0249 family)
MAYLTVNADDFGMTGGVTRGILTAMAGGIVTSAAAMTCAEDSEKNIRTYKNITSGVIGLHLQLTDGRPVLPPEEIPSLVDDTGNFFPSARSLPWDINPAEVYLEWSAQVLRLQTWGIFPRYLDSHHHVHLTGRLLPVIARLGNELHLPVRSGPPGTSKKLRYFGVSTPDVTIIDFFGEHLNREKLEQALAAALKAFGHDAVIELSCHPGLSCHKLEKMSRYNRQREIELQILTAGETIENITNLGLNLIGMNEVSHYRPADLKKHSA